ncbi:MAG: HAD-IB family phosphatase [Lachnospiraceae bacterium]|nr:HAD-IB family phosphatase [Lachnospiraceae bacterium]
MSRYIFLFDLDSTITRQEILPTIAKEAGVYEQMSSLTESSMRGEVPFKQSFLQRVELLKKIPVSKVQDIVTNIELNDKLVEFIYTNKNRSYIVTGNLDIWIEGLMVKLGMEKNIFCSKAVQDGNYVQDVFNIVDKDAVIRQMVLPFVAVGDGNNDAEMIEAAEVGIGYGGVRPIAPSVLECATHVVYEEDKLVDFLNKLV